MSYSAHQQSSQPLVIRCAVLTLSDTRNESTDNSGQTIRQLLIEAGHEIAHYQVLPDDPIQLHSTLTDLLNRPTIDIILTNGGTGISPRDQTVPTIERLLESPLPGFGELFRVLSYEQIQSGAILSRAIAGIAKKKAIFAMPGSTKAVELAMTRLILPEMKHIVFELRK